MLVDAGLAAVGKADALGDKPRIPRLPDVLHDGRDEPEGIVGAGVLQPVDIGRSVPVRNHGRRLEGLLGFGVPGGEPGRLKKVDSVACACEPRQQFHDPLPAAGRIRMGNRHGVLGRVPVAKACPPADFDEGGKAGKGDIDLGLVEVPDIEHGVHILIRGMNRLLSDLCLPIFLQTAVLEVRGRRVLVLLPEPGAFNLSPFAQEENDSLLLSGLQGETLHEGCAVVAGQLDGLGSFSFDHRLRGLLRAVGSEEAVPHGVEAVHVFI